MLSTKQAAARLGISDQRVRELIYDGVLPATRWLRGMWLIDADDLDKARQRKTRPGPEPKQKA